MLVSAISKEEIYQISLPEKVKGQYWLYTGSNKKEKLASIEGVDGEWILKPYRKYKISDSKNKTAKSTVLTLMQMVVVEDKDKEKTIVFAEPITEDRQVFKKYIFRNDASITIGRNLDNDISFNSKVVSAHHAKLSFVNKVWRVTDTGSANGVFVNGKRVEEQNLDFGDLVLVMGLKVIVGKNFIALNNPDKRVKISKKLVEFAPQNIEKTDEDEHELTEKEYFYRSPRFKREVETFEISIDSPPSSPIADDMPMALALGTSLAMGMMSIVTLTNAIATQNYLTMAMGGSMLLGTVFLPVITKTYEKRRKRKKEMLRQKRYHEYLDKIAVEIEEECERQKEIINENIVTIEECENRILNKKRNLWERTIDHNDFLHTRVGVGNSAPAININYSGKKFTIEDDNLNEELYALAQRKKELTNVPLSYSLFEHFVSGIIGKREEVLNFAKGLIIQLAAMYSYDEVKFIFLYDQEEESELKFVKWLPHVWSDDKKFRFISNSDSEVKEISAYLATELENRLEMNESDIEECSPYYVIFSFSKDLAVRSELIKSVVSSKENIHFSLVTFYDELRNLPKECSVVVELNGEQSKLYDKNDVAGQSVEFRNDIFLSKKADELSIALANTPLNSAASNFQLPNMITFLNMFGVGKIEHLNALDRWKENDPTSSLEAAVGVDNLGGLFHLDLHEKFHGPHGLVAGTTGSGKSEFIITYILSLAINYHPEEVAFILIDYKGGGMAKSFESLPHTVGIITNLDGAAIKRSLVSIESELKRRQGIFAEASKKVQMSNIDIYKYQKLYREGLVDEPLQHLFIISDEFAELKTQQPEFMTQLVSAARIGRSLGVHLILATQKPSGVVDDQIWSNSRFKVCLKVQDKADSMDMLKRPDAAELAETGRFYLQVGYNELFEIGQSAWSGAPYYPSDSVSKERDLSVNFIDNNGLSIKSVKLDNRKNMFKNPPKQVDAITDYLNKIADEENIHIRQLWLEPIPAIILVNDLYKKYNIKTKKFVLDPVVGEYDDPARQQQKALTLPISKNGNTIVYGAAGSGKTTFINALIYSLITHHSPEEVNLYLLDFASETLGMFKDAPHVGDVMLAFEEEKINNMFKMLFRELNLRKKLFSEYGGDYNSFIENSKQEIPSIVVVINNFAAFTEIYQNQDEAVSFLTREGTKYGIHFVITSVGVNGVRFRLLQNFKQLITLQLNDDSDYTNVVGKTDGLLPSKIKGRGLIRTDNLYEFQTANVVSDGSLRSYVNKTIEKLNKDYKGSNANRVPVLPEIVDVDYIGKQINDKKSVCIPVGVNENNIQVVSFDFNKHYINLVLSNNEESQDFACCFINVLSKFTNHEIYGVNVPSSFGFTSNKKTNLSTSINMIEDQIDKLFDLSVSRNNAYHKSKNKKKTVDSFDDIFIVFNSFASFYNNLNAKSKEKLQLILDKGISDYKMYFIISDTSNSISTYSYENWFKNNVNNNNGIWLGNGIADQYVIKPLKIDNVLRQPISEGFGYVLIGGKPQKIKVLSSLKSGDEDGK